MTRRPGLSLTEVLVALFIMAIGTISILTMFPLGALQMGQALKDDRTAQAAAQADAYMRWYWKDMYDDMTAGTRALDNEPFFQVMDNPKAGLSSASDGRGLFPVAATSDDCSYPVVVDPMGFVARPVGPGLSQLWLGDDGFNDKVPPTGNRSAVRRVNLRTRTPRVDFVSALALRTCTLLDGHTYDQSGTPDTSASGGMSFERDLRYNWLWVLQRSRNADRYTVPMTVVVFDKRAHVYAPAGSETVFTPTFAAADQTQIQFNTTSAPKVQKGGWIMDVTTTTIDSGTHVMPSLAFTGSSASTPGVRNAKFYQVVSVTENGASTNIELQTPLEPDSKGPTVPALTDVTLRRFIVLSGVAEVYVRSEPLTVVNP